MNGVHDMGGMHGFGPVQREEDEPVFHEAWEGRVYGMLRQVTEKLPASGAGGLRDTIERMAPARYLASSYYERFLEVVEKRALAAGVVTESEIEARMRLIEKEGGDPIPPTRDAATVERVRTRLKTQSHPTREGAPPRFAKGDQVVARNLNWPGHNRLPRYIRGKRGVIERVNGLCRIEDAHADALGPNPQTVYTVRLDAQEVWGPECEPNARVLLELWEGYLEPASGD